jgi:hypothetical protein
MNLFIYLIHIILYFPLSKIKQDTVVEPEDGICKLSIRIHLVI